MILTCTRPILVGPRGRAGTAQPPPDDDGPVQTETLGWPSTACTSFEHEAPTQADHQPVMDTAGDHTPTPAIPAIRLPAHAALQDLTSAGHSGRGNA